MHDDRFKDLRSNSKILLLRWLPLLALGAVVAHYLWFVYRHAVNIPYHDDIYDFLNFVIQVDSANSLRAVFDALWTNYNDHRTSASRLLVYGVYLVQDEVNFHSLTLLAHLALLFILMLFYMCIRSDEHKWVYILTAALLLLNLRSHPLMFFSQGGFAYYYVFFYAFASLFALHNVTGFRLVIAAVLSTLATFTLASGQIVWLIGLASLLQQSLVSRRKSIKYSLIWFLLAIAVLILWRIGFVVVHDKIPAGLPSDQLVDSPVSLPLYLGLARYISWFLVILGCAFIDFSVMWAGVVGFIMLAILTCFTVKSYKCEDVRLVLCGWYVVLAAAAVSAGRALQIRQTEYILNERYSLLSVLLFCILFLLFQKRHRVCKSTVAYLMVLMAGMYSAWTFYHFKNAAQQTLNSRYELFNDGIYWVIRKPIAESVGIVNKAISAGIYHPPCRPFPACEASNPFEK